MPKPPATPPSSDVDGVDRDYRTGLTSDQPDPNAAQQLRDARENSSGRPKASDDEADGNSRLP